MTTRSPVVAVLGLGEAGGEIARDLLAAGAQVRGYDPRVRPGPGLLGCGSDAEASNGAALVLALTSAHEAEQTLRQAADGIAPGSVYADLNTASAGVKSALAEIAAAHAVAFVDVALMAPVPGRGLHTPMLACGPGADAFAATLSRLGASVEVLTGPPGTAATRKLVRSVFYKGLAAAVIESLRAGRAAGCEEWLRASIAQELSQASASTVQRLEQGSRTHALRRSEEMAAAAALLDELGVPARMARASEQWLRQLLGEQPTLDGADG